LGFRWIFHAARAKVRGVKRLRPPTHVIFDLDGVLLDTEPIYTLGTRQIAARWGKAYGWELKAEIMGRAPLEGARLVVETLGLALTPEQYLIERDLIVEEMFSAAPPIEGAPELVAALDRCGLPLGIATSSERRLFDLKAQNHAWLGAMRVVVCGDDPGAGRHKPAPDIFLRVAGALGAEPTACLVFEDSLAGVAAARAAGMQVVARVEPHFDRARFSEADLVLRSYAELDLAVLCSPLA
jgi:HAD superfamily hydrolase (TIGR01509 family)